MQTVNIHEAKTQFSKLLEKVQKGDVVIIAKAGQPIAKLTAWHPEKHKVAPPGGMEDQGFWLADDFNESVDELFEE
jgi:prevent-host-death family protein